MIYSADCQPIGIKKDELKRFGEAVEEVVRQDNDTERTFNINADGSRTTVSYFEKHLKHLDKNSIPNKKHTRTSLRSFASKGNGADIEIVCASILAWGGMHSVSFGSLFSSPHKQDWLDIAESIRAGNHTREEAYYLFLKKRAEKTTDGKPSRLPWYGASLFHKTNPFFDAKR